MSETTSLQYVPYSDDVEQIQPEEETIVRQVVESFDRLRNMTFEKHRHAMRDAHAKSHGALKGELHVYDNLPPHLAQGLFAQARTYPIIVRFSSAPGDVQSDDLSSFRGMAIKAIGVEGKKVLEAEADAVTQDFLLVNHPVIPTGDVSSYLKEQLKQEKKAAAPEEAQTLVSKAMRGVNEVAMKVGVEIKPDVVGSNKPQTHILGETFFSMAAHRYGDYIAKVNATPYSASVLPLAGQHIDTSDPSTLRNLVVEFFSQNSAEYELGIQLCTDLEKMPVEDASVEWDENASPYVPVAKIVIPQQEAYTPARRVFADEKLSFTPWHTLPAHRPLGSIQRVRVAAYEASTKFRHEMNQQPRIEPHSIDEMPD
ncbi:catalase [bacterium]|nr:MAG: catalase [bacterium]